jgi:hypothetical protein
MIGVSGHGSWRRSLAAGATALVALTVAACGVPGGGKPIVDSHPINNANQSGAGIAQQPPQPSDSNLSEPLEFVEEGYLAAVAGQVTAKAQQTAATAFMQPPAIAAWTPGPNKSGGPQSVAIIQLISKNGPTQTGGTFELTESVRVIGMFDPVSGAITTQAAGPTVNLLFDGAIQDDGHWRLTYAPPGLYMTQQAFNASYHSQTIYYWNADGLTATSDSGMIPDLRYMPTWLSAAQAATQVVTWILDGPPTWMNAAAAEVVSNVNLADPTMKTVAGAFVVNLTSPATAMSAQEQTDLVAEISWSLGNIRPISAPISSGLTPISLQINNHDVASTAPADLDRLNRAAFRNPTPTAYAIVGKKVAPIGYTDDRTNWHEFNTVDAVPDDSTKTIDNVANNNVQLAAIHSTDSEMDAALVTSVNGVEQLWVSRAKAGQKAKYVKIKHLPTSGFLRPVWLDQPGNGLAVVVGGNLYLVTSSGAVREVAVPNVGAITAFSIGSDGYRIALVADGKAWIGLLAVSSQAFVTVPTVINLASSLRSVTAIAWSSISQVIVAGPGAPGTESDGQAIVLEVNTDGNSPTIINSYGSTTITQLASYPTPPPPGDRDSTSLGPVMLQTTTGAFAGRASKHAFLATKTPPGAPTSPFFAD